MCALKVKFFDQGHNNNLGQRATKIYNQVIGVKKLGQSSNAQTFADIIKEKILFNNNMEIKKNIIGLTTDRAQTLLGDQAGLITLLRKDFDQQIFHLPDPCHSLSLVIKHSLGMLPEEIRTFISDINNYFASPQRKEKLKAIQKEGGYSILMPIRYVKTRWLSLGDSIARIIEIWPSLQVYMNTYAGEKGVRVSRVIEDFNDPDIELVQINYKTLSSQLNSDSFYTKISMLSLIINRINGYNRVFQSQSLDISQLKLQTYECFSSILELFILPQKLDLQNLRTYFNINWTNTHNHEIWFLNSNDFIKKLKTEYPSQFNKLKNLTTAQEENFCQVFRVFAAQLLDRMVYYLPLEDKIIETFDFIQDINNYGDLLNKTLEFNNHFKILEDSQLPELKKEILKLTSQRRSKYEQGAANMIEVWDRIEDDVTNGFQFTVLPKLVKMAQSLPTSSSDVEQTFSGIKLIKTLLRNRLSAEKIESILLIIQAYGGKKKIDIDKKLIELHEDLSKVFSEKKKSKIRNSPNLLEKNEEEKIDSFSKDKDHNELIVENAEDVKIDEEEVIWDNILSCGEKVQSQVIVEDKLKAEVLGKQEGLKKMKNY